METGAEGVNEEETEVETVGVVAVTVEEIEGVGEEAEVEVVAVVETTDRMRSAASTV